MAHIYAERHDWVQANAPDLLTDKEAFLREQRAHRAWLVDCLAMLEREASAIDAERTTPAAPHREPSIDWGGLRRLSPVSDVWGLDRGQPLDRCFIERFLAQHQSDIGGRVLEVKDAWYSRRFGGARVTQFDVIDIDRHNASATIVGDLESAAGVGPSEAFDCFILTQTLHINYDTRAVLANVYRMLKPGGVLLCTVPCVSRVSDEDGGLDGGDYWRFTEAGIRRALAEVFRAESVDVTSYGNVKVCSAFLLGLASHELSATDLDATDPWFPLICCARAVKPTDDGVADVAVAGAALSIGRRPAGANPPPCFCTIASARTVRTHSVSSSIQPCFARICRTCAPVTSRCRSKSSWPGP